jgi:hypothetical protein
LIDCVVSICLLPLLDDLLADEGCCVVYTAFWVVIPASKLLIPLSCDFAAVRIRSLESGVAAPSTSVAAAAAVVPRGPGHQKAPRSGTPVRAGATSIVRAGATSIVRASPKPQAATSAYFPEAVQGDACQLSHVVPMVSKECCCPCRCSH